MKPYLKHNIPLEVWTDVNKCTWISRRGMALLANQFGDRRFAEILMFFLHEHGNVTLGGHYIFMYIENPLKIRRVVMQHFRESNSIRMFPQEEISNNIKNFESIQISYIDDEVLSYLWRLSPVLNAVNLRLDFGPERPTHWPNMICALHNILPYINGVQSLSITKSCYGDSLTWILEQQTFQALFSKVQMFSTEISNALHIDMMLQWLTTNGNQFNGPKLLLIEKDVRGFHNRFSGNVRENFINATTASSFAIYIRYDYYDWNQPEEYRLENENTGELLVSVWRNGSRVLEIYRYINGNESQMRTWLDSNQQFVVQPGFMHKRISLSIQDTGCSDE